MCSTLTRIADLEAKVGGVRGPRRVYRVCGRVEGETPAAFIRSQGLPLDEEDDLILHRVPMAPSPNGPVRVDRPWGWTGMAPGGVDA
jgi:hypothetical protein